MDSCTSLAKGDPLIETRFKIFKNFKLKFVDNSGEKSNIWHYFLACAWAIAG